MAVVSSNKTPNLGVKRYKKLQIVRLTQNTSHTEDILETFERRMSREGYLAVLACIAFGMATADNFCSESTLSCYHFNIYKPNWCI